MAGWEIVGGLAQGLAAGKGEAKNRAMKQEMQNVLLEQHKLQGKMLEAKMKEMDLKQQAISKLMGQGTQTGDTQPMIPLTANASGGPVSLPPQLPPTEMAPTLTVPQTLAQGQLGSAINPPKQTGAGGPLSERDKLNALYYTAFGTPLQKPSISVKELSDGSLLVLKDGIPQQRIAGPTQYGQVPITGTQGQPGVGFVPKPGTGGMAPMSGAVPPPGAGMPLPQLGQKPQQQIPGTVPGYFTGPSPLEMPEKMPESVREKVTKVDIFLNRLKSLKQFAESSKDVFGAIPKGQLKVSESFVGGLPGIGPAIQPSGDVIAFHKLLTETANERIHEFGGSALTAQELMRVMAQLPSHQNKKSFLTAVNTIIDAAERDKDVWYKQYGKAQTQKAEEAGGAVQIKAPFFNAEAAKDSKTWEEFLQKGVGGR